MDAMASGNIKVDSAVRIKYVTALTIMAGVQEHGMCRVAGLLENGMEAQQILSSMDDIPVRIIRDGEGSELLFRGIIKTASVHMANGVSCIEMDAVTASEKLDRMEKQRSFQDVSMTYEQVVRRILEPYGDMNAVCAADALKTINEPVIQYGETDWEFLKRLGSHLNIPVYADCESGSKALYFGMEKGSRKYYGTDRKEDRVTRKDYVYYKVRGNENGRIGDHIDIESGSYVVFRKRIELVHEELEFTYWAGGCGNWYIPYIAHDRLTGMEFTGKVVSTQAERLKVNLQIDEPYEGADYEWEWTPVSGNIMYAMPERGTTVRLCFGSANASEGAACTNPRDNGDGMPGQQKRTFTTAAGKRMELHPEHLSMQGSGGQAALSDGNAVTLGSSSRMELTASGMVRMEAATIHAYTPQEINMFRARARCEEKGRDIIPNGTKSNPPTGTGDVGFTFNNEFNALSSASVLCMTDFIRYKPYNDDPEETEPDEEEGFSWGKLAGYCLAGLTVVGGVALGAGYVASIIFTGGATAAFAPWVVGGLAGFCGTVAVGGMAVNDYRRQEVSGIDAYMMTGLISSTEGAVAGAAFCMVPYASEVMVAQIVPYGMTGVALPTGVFVSSETIMNAAMLSGYTATFSNMAVKVNDSMAGATGYNAMANAMGPGNYQFVKESSAAISNVLLLAGLSNPRLYGTNNSAGNIQENASYKNKQRPTWRESEIDAAKDYPGYDAQKSFINGKEVPYGTKGSVRPDYYINGNSVEVKNYDVEAQSGRSSLARNIEKQYNQRISNLPAGTKQTVLIDTRGQTVSDKDLGTLYDDIMKRTNNGVEIVFKKD